MKKLLESINKLNNVVAYKVNVEKPVALLYTNSESSDK